MKTERGGRPSVAEKAKEELLEFLAISLYLAVFLSALVNYRRIVLAEVGISYAHYGYALVEALILGKLILVGEALRLGRTDARRPLLVAALVKSLWFGAFVLAFLVLEHVLRAAVARMPIGPEVASAFARPAQVLAHVLLVIAALVPFFMLREAGRQLGEERLLRLLLRRPDAAKPPAGRGEPAQRAGSGPTR